MSFFKQVNLLFLVIFSSSLLIDAALRFSLKSLYYGVLLVGPILYLLSLLMITTYIFAGRKFKSIGYKKMTIVKIVSLAIIGIISPMYIYFGATQISQLPFVEFLVQRSTIFNLAEFFFKILLWCGTASFIRLRCTNENNELNEDILDAGLDR